MNLEVAKNFRSLGTKVICIGRNYREHAKELNNPVPTKPMLFMKPTSSYITQGQTIKTPPGCSKLHYEVELGVVVGRKATGITASSASDHIAGYLLALDMTARDFQDEAKKLGHPWLLPKGFDTSCPVSEFIPKAAIPDPGNVDLWLKVNDVLKQKGNTSDMIFNIPTLMEYITKFVTLCEGDVVLTGTPAGVGPVLPGDTISCGLGKDGELASFQFPVE